MRDEDISAVYLRILAEKAEDSLERDSSAVENASRLADAVKSRSKSGVDTHRDDPLHEDRAR